MRKQVSNRAVWVAIAVFLLPHSGAGHQDKKQASNSIASQETLDRFIGVWKLRVDKTQSAGTFSQVITIEDQGKDYRFTYDLAVNGKENHLSYVTDMKGETVKSVQKDGQPAPGKSRITRIDSSSFKVESEIGRDIYKVSADGLTMKVKKTYSVTTRPNVLKDGELLFDREK